MTLVVLAGLGVGIGGLGVATGLRKSRRSLHAVLTAVDRETTLPGLDNGPPFGSGRRNPRAWRIDERLGERLVTLLDNRLTAHALRSWLEPSLVITGTSLQTLCSQAALGGIVGFLLPFVFWATVVSGGLHASVAMPAWAGLLCACAGLSLPIVALSAKVKRRRQVARKVVGVFLDLVVLCLAGGMGIEGALLSASQVGDDDVSTRIFSRLTHARDSGDPPWHALARLGLELGVDELAELAAAAGLAGTQGARIRSTLAAKAASIRRHELADAEAQANTVTERLFLPGVLLLVGFLLFIGYPAVARITNGF